MWEAGAGWKSMCWECLDILDNTFQCRTDTHPHPASHSHLFTLMLLKDKHTPALFQLPRNSPVCCHNPTLALDQDILAVLSHSWDISLSFVKCQVSSDSVGSFWRKQTCLNRIISLSGFMSKFQMSFNPKWLFGVCIVDFMHSGEHFRPTVFNC